MRGYIAEMLEELSWRLMRLQDLMNGLMEMECGNGAEPAAVVVVGAPETRGEDEPRNRRSTRTVKVEGKLHPETPRIAGCVARLAEPFRSKEIQEAAGIDLKKASNFCTQGKIKGWLKGLGNGAYQRTRKFPAAVKLVADFSAPLKKGSRPPATAEGKVPPITKRFRAARTSELASRQWRRNERAKGHVQRI